MAEPQPPTITEGATTGDIADTVADPALSTSNSAEDRKAAAALDALDDRRDVEAGQGKHVDQEAVKKAMDRLAGMQEKPAVKKGEGRKEEVKKKAVKVDDAVVNLLIDQLDLNKVKATELLKASDGDAVKAIRSFITA